MTEEQVTTSVGTTDAMTIGIQEALARISNVKCSPTLVDSFSKEAWSSWNAFEENALVFDINGLDLSDEEDEELPQAA